MIEGIDFLKCTEKNEYIMFYKGNGLSQLHYQSNQRIQSSHQVLFRHYFRSEFQVQAEKRTCEINLRWTQSNWLNQCQYSSWGKENIQQHDKKQSSWLPTNKGSIFYINHEPYHNKVDIDILNHCKTISHWLGNFITVFVTGGYTWK